MSIRVGIVGIAGYGGGEALRYIAQHPEFELVYAAGESTAGSKVSERYPSVPSPIGDLIIQRFDPDEVVDVQVLFTSLPTGASKELLSKVPSTTKVVDIGGDHRYVEGWTYGLADVWPEQIRGKTRIANPGCYPAATLTVLAPLVVNRLIDPGNLIIDAKSGISGAGRGGGDSKFGYAECNEDLTAYGLLKHTHMPEIMATIDKLCGNQPGASNGLVFTPHLIPMTRGILVTIYARGTATTEQCLEVARTFYRDRKFVKVISQSPHTKWASGSNLAFVSYACDPSRQLVIGLGAIDNLGKGAAGQAIQNANLICDLPEELGLDSVSLWP